MGRSTGRWSPMPTVSFVAGGSKPCSGTTPMAGPNLVWTPRHTYPCRFLWTGMRLVGGRPHLVARLHCVPTAHVPRGVRSAELALAWHGPDIQHGGPSVEEGRPSQARQVACNPLPFHFPRNLPFDTEQSGFPHQIEGIGGCKHPPLVMRNKSKDLGGRGSAKGQANGVVGLD